MNHSRAETIFENSFKQLKIRSFTVMNLFSILKKGLPEPPGSTIYM